MARPLFTEERAWAAARATYAEAREAGEPPAGEPDPRVAIVWRLVELRFHGGATVGVLGRLAVRLACLALAAEGVEVGLAERTTATWLGIDARRAPTSVADLLGEAVATVCAFVSGPGEAPLLEVTRLANAVGALLEARETALRGLS